MDIHQLRRKAAATVLAVCVVAASCSVSAFAAGDAAKDTYLSDMGMTAYRNNEDARPSVDKNQAGGAIQLGGTDYEKGICLTPGADFKAQVHYDLTGYNGDTFTAVVGREASAASGSAVAHVYCDGKETFKSGSLTAGSKENISVSVAGVTDLWLVVEDGGDGNTGDVIAFADAKISASATAAAELGNVSLSKLNPVSQSAVTVKMDKNSDDDPLQITLTPYEKFKTAVENLSQRLEK